MLKYSSLVILFLFNFVHSMRIHGFKIEQKLSQKSSIIFDPIGSDVNYPVYSNCLQKDDFTQDPNDNTKFYRCADGWQNSMRCAPGTVFEGLLYEDQLIVVKNQCGFKINNSPIFFEIEQPAPKSSIIFDPKGLDVVQPVVSGCLNSDDFTKDPNDDTKFYRCADGVQNSMHCAPGTVFEGLLYQDQLVVMEKQCGYKL
jgi:hypothetical protein